jgi:hypothetical protein
VIVGSTGPGRPYIRLYLTMRAGVIRELIDEIRTLRQDLARASNRTEFRLTRRTRPEGPDDPRVVLE